MIDTFLEDQIEAYSLLVDTQLGLYFPRDRWKDLLRHTKSAAIEFGFTSTEPFLEWLLSTPLTQEQIEKLASHLTIAETYFWREPKVFEALRDQILPTLIHQRKSGSKQLRIWSAGCSTGEEPYTLAIILRKLIPDIKNWNITLLATDINPQSLEKAAAGIYGKWSFRKVPQGFIKEYFSPVGDNKFEILPEIRKIVNFSYLNLVEDNYPSAISNTNAMDLIFCRNVLIYFTQAHARQVSERLYRALLEGGWLVVGSSDLSQDIFSQFKSNKYPGAIIYQRDHNGINRISNPAKNKLVNEIRPFYLPLEKISAAAKTTPPYEENLPKLEVSLPEEPAQTAEQDTDTSDITAIVRKLANQGKLEEALSACEKAIAQNKLLPVLHFLHANILQELKKDDESITALKHAVYLDPQFIMAHINLGILTQRQNNSISRKHFQNALDILSNLDPDEVLLEADGLSVKRLIKIINTNLQIGTIT